MSRPCSIETLREISCCTRIPIPRDWAMPTTTADVEAEQRSQIPVANDIALLKDNASVLTEECTGHPPLTIIEPRAAWQFVDVGELWRYRELLFFLIWRDVKVRYKQTVLGAAWAILQPFAQMVVFRIFLGLMIEVPSGA